MTLYTLVIFPLISLWPKTLNPHHLLQQPDQHHRVPLQSTFTMLTPDQMRLGDRWDQFLQNPIQFIQQFAQNEGISFVQGRDPQGLHSLVQQNVSSVIQSKPDLISSIPLVNHLDDFGSIPNGSLVRFSGMIQDMFDPLIFQGFPNQVDSTQRVCSLYWETPDTVGPYNDSLMDKYHYFCINIPGQNPWVQGLGRPAQPKDTPEPESSKSIETKTEDLPSNEAKKLKNVTPGIEEKKEAEPKKRTFSLLEQLERSFPRHPIVGGRRNGFMIKLNEQREDLLLNQLIEVIGIWDAGTGAFEAVPTAKKAGDDLFEVTEETFLDFPKQFSPHIHAITCTGIRHVNPLVSNQDVKTVEMTTDLVVQEKTRSYLLNLLTECLFGDELAAEYLLLSLTSHIHTRTKEIGILGSLPINLMNVPHMSPHQMKKYTFILRNVLSNITCQSIYLPVSCDTLNGDELYPFREDNVDKMFAGKLQVPDDTIILVDETVLDNGTLKDAGIRNFKCLNDLIKLGDLVCDYYYSVNQIPLDPRIIVLSEGKSLFEGTIQVPIQPKADWDLDTMFKVIDENVDQSMLEDIRRFITTRRDLKFNIPSSVAKELPTCFTELRKQKPNVGEEASMSPAQYMNNVLNIMRIHCVSHGIEDLTVDVWKQIVEMEDKRFARITSLKSK